MLACSLVSSFRALSEWKFFRSFWRYWNLLKCKCILCITIYMHSSFECTVCGLLLLIAFRLMLFTKFDCQRSRSTQNSKTRRYISARIHTHSHSYTHFSHESYHNALENFTSRRLFRLCLAIKIPQLIFTFILSSSSTSASAQRLLLLLLYYCCLLFCWKCENRFQLK